MQKIVYSIFAALALAACTADFDGCDKVVENNPNDKILNSSTDCVEGTILVCFNSSAESRLAKCATRSGATRTGVEGVDILLDKVSGYNVEPVFVITDKNRDKVYAQGLHLWYELSFDKGADADILAKELSAVAEVQYVQFNRKVCRVDAPKPLSVSEPTTMAAASPAKSKIPYNDIYASYQWSLNNLGKDSKVGNAGVINKLPEVVAGADINVLPAWKLCKGDPSITVAVLDEGVMYTHEDLVDNIWINQAEKDGTYGVDDDNNGYADDIYGYNFCFLNDDISWDHDNDSGHGTHVAGIISAVNNNGKGICGIAGGSGKKDGVKIMTIQVFFGTGGASTANIAKGMQYAADNGAHIMQCSWGYDNDLAKNDASYKRKCMVEAQAINYFIANGGTEDGPIDGGVVIFAAGNETQSLPCYPAAYEPCIAVASFTPALKPAYYTNYGIGTDIVAPGGEMLYSYGSILSTLPSKFQKPSDFNGYGLMQGTSQACPHVSGIAALGLSYAKQLGKRYTANEFRSMLLSATNDIEPYLTGGISLPLKDGNKLNINYPSYSGKLGAGYIDAYKLMLQIDGTPYSVVKRGVDSEIDLSTYFGDGILNSEFSKIEITDEDKANIGLGDCIYNAGKLTVNCANIGTAKLTITMLIGGSADDNTQKPYPTEVTKSFVLLSKAEVPTNNGWL